MGRGQNLLTQGLFGEEVDEGGEGLDHTLEAEIDI